MFTFMPASPALSSKTEPVERKGIVQYAVERERERLTSINTIRKNLK